MRPRAIQSIQLKRKTPRDRSCSGEQSAPHPLGDGEHKARRATPREARSLGVASRIAPRRLPPHRVAPRGAPPAEPPRRARAPPKAILKWGVSPPCRAWRVEQSGAVDSLCCHCAACVGRGASGPPRAALCATPPHRIGSHRIGSHLSDAVGAAADGTTVPYRLNRRQPPRTRCSGVGTATGAQRLWHSSRSRPLKCAQQQ